MRIIITQKDLTSYYEDEMLITPLSVSVTSRYDISLSGLVKFFRDIAYCVFSFTKKQWYFLDSSFNRIEFESFRQGVQFGTDNAVSEHIYYTFCLNMIEVYKKIVLSYFIHRRILISEEYCIDEPGNEPPPISDEEIERFSLVEGG